jgi:hypothetical protein
LGFFQYAPIRSGETGFRVVRVQFERHASLVVEPPETPALQRRGFAIGVVGLIAATLISQTVRDLVASSGLTFEDAGEHELKGVPDRWHLYRA